MPDCFQDAIKLRKEVAPVREFREVHFPGPVSFRLTRSEQDRDSSDWTLIRKPDEMIHPIQDWAVQSARPLSINSPDGLQ